MTNARRLEALALLAGAALLVAGTAAIDWRAGCILAGLLLLASTVDPQGLRR